MVMIDEVMISQLIFDEEGVGRAGKRQPNQSE